jgi:capsular polysaccharide transport system permease protein
MSNMQPKLTPVPPAASDATERGEGKKAQSTAAPAAHGELLLPPSGPGQGHAIALRGKQQVARKPEAPTARPAQRQVPGGTLIGSQPHARAVPAHPPRAVPMPPARIDIQRQPELKQFADALLAMRGRRRRNFFLRLGCFVGLPTLAALLYVFLWATPRYVTEFEVTYQLYQPQQSLATGGLLSNIMSSSQGGTVDYGTLLYEYIRSPALLTKLDSQLNLRQYYSSDKVDYPSRLNPAASGETFLEYYLWHIVSVSEGLGGYITIDVTAFDPEFALTLATAITQASDEMIDNLTARARHDEVRFAEEELAREQDNERSARLALTAFQNLHGELAPQTVATQLGQIAGGLEGQLATARTELSDAQGFLLPGSPQVVQLKSKIAALEKQLLDQRQRLANTNSGTPFSKILDEYSALQLNEQFAASAVQSAQQGLVVARTDAARKENYLVDFVSPYAPDTATIWFPIDITLTVFLGSLLTYAIGSLLMGAFRDQAGM